MATTSPIVEAKCPHCGQVVRVAMSWKAAGVRVARECHVHVWAGNCGHYTITEQPNGAGVVIKFDGGAANVVSGERLAS